MVILLHGHYPRYIIKCHGADAKVRVIWDTADFFDEAVEVGGWGAVDGCDEVGRGEAVLIGGRSTALTTLALYHKGHSTLYSVQRTKGTYSCANINLTMQL